MPESETGTSGSPPSTGRLILWMLFVVILGMPMVYVLWGALNNILLGDLASVRWAVVLPVLVVFVGFLYWVNRLIRRWDARE